MAAGESSSAMVQQLSRQLHAVSEIAESLTLRMLALEERFGQIESSFNSAAHQSDDDDDSRQLLVESSDRLKHLQGLLDDMASVDANAPKGVDEPEVPTSSSPAIEYDLMESEEQLEGDLHETVYVDDPQIDHLEEQQELISHEGHDDQIDLLSA